MATSGLAPHAEARASSKKGAPAAQEGGLGAAGERLTAGGSGDEGATPTTSRIMSPSDVHGLIPQT